ncbi:MAG: DUF6512 family protein [Oscillospiraceae bacterium]
MEKQFGRSLLAFFAALAVGVGLHFLYDFFPNVLTALIAPVNESIWEHLKLLFWPLLVWGIYAIHKGSPMGGQMLALLISSALLLSAGYLYHIVFSGEGMVFDIVLFLVTMALGFWLPARLEKLLQGRWGELFLLLVIALGVAIILFTFLPPDYPLYTDFSAQNTWKTIPY